jgi:hypothetical protein
LLAGCPKLTAGDNTGSAGSSGSNCSPLDGVYKLTYTKASGDCPSQPDELVSFNAGESVMSPAQRCTGAESMSTPCTLKRDTTCNISDPLTGSLLGVAQVSGSLNEVGDNTTIEGSLDVILNDTSGMSCMGTFTVRGTLQ